MSFIQELKAAGWKEDGASSRYTKGHWVLSFDTSSWIELGTTDGQRIFDVPVPDRNREQWTIYLIEHLCKTDDALRKR